MRQAIETYDCDYKPFGELDGGDEPTKHGFATAEYDGESSCFAMGMRMYSAELGRFLSVDPLFEAIPRHTPYHYSFNSPLVWKDPSGLIPENEKDQDRLMMVLFDEAKFAEEAYNRISEENYRNALFGTMMGKFLYGLPGSMEEALEWYIYSMGCPGGGGRTGEDGSGNNGILIEYKEQVIDNDGNTTWQDRHARYYQGQLYNEDGSDYSGNDEFVQKIYGWIMDLLAIGDPEIICRIETLESSPRGHWLRDHGDVWKSTFIENLEDHIHGNEPSVPVSTRVYMSPIADIYSFTHDFLGHAYHYETGTYDYRSNEFGVGNCEVQAINIENLMRFYTGANKRTEYWNHGDINNRYLWDTHKNQGR